MYAVKGQSKCDVCNKPCKGYAYRCSACSFQMHPCCAMLKTEMSLLLAHAHTLRLQPADKHNNDVQCGECKRKRSGRVYQCTYCGYHIHAVCAKDFINGLRENGIKPIEKSNNMLGTAARLASQARSTAKKQKKKTSDIFIDTDRSLCIPNFFKPYFHWLVLINFLIRW